MVVLYNRNIVNYNTSDSVKNSNIKRYKKRKHFNHKFSRTQSSQRITPENKIFLKSLGLKVLV